MCVYSLSRQHKDRHYRQLYCHSVIMLLPSPKNYMKDMINYNLEWYGSGSLSFAVNYCWCANVCSKNVTIMWINWQGKESRGSRRTGICMHVSMCTGLHSLTAYCYVRQGCYVGVLPFAGLSVCLLACNGEAVTHAIVIDICLSVRLSVCQMRGLWQNEST